MADKKKTSNLGDEDIKRIRKLLKEENKDVEQAIAERVKQAMSDAGGGLAGGWAGIKEAGKARKIARVAIEGKKTNRADFFRGAGFENLGNFVDAFFEKRATKEEQEEAKKELGIKDKKPEAKKSSFGATKGLAKRVATISDNISAIRSDVEYIKDRVSPKEFDAKKEGGKDGETQRVQYDPLAPEGEKYRQVGENGKVSTVKVSKAHMKSANMKAAAMMHKTGQEGKYTSQVSPKKKESSKSKPNTAGVAAAFTDPEEASPFDDDLKNALAADPMAGVMKLLKSMDTKIDTILKGVGNGESDDSIKNILSMISDITGPIKSMVGPVVRALGPMARVGAAAYVGYEIGSWLEKEFKLGDKISSAVDKVAGFFGGGTKGAAKEAATKSSKDLSDKRNAGLKDTGWKYVVKAGSSGGWESESKKSASESTPSVSGGEQGIMNMIKEHEGVRYKPYKDSLGLWTVGVGHLIGDGKSLPPEYNREFSQKEVDDMFAKDYEHHRKAAEKIPGFSNLGQNGQGALTDLTFNMGPSWYKKWPNFVKTLSSGDIEGAASNLERSKWYTQVGRRGPRIVSLLRSEADGTKSDTPSQPSVEPSRVPPEVQAAPTAATSSAPELSRVPPSVQAAPTATGSVAMSPSNSGPSIDTVSRENSVAREEASQPSVIPPIVMPAPTARESTPMERVTQRIEQAVARKIEASFNRALAKDFSHPTAFTTISML